MVCYKGKIRKYRYSVEIDKILVIRGKIRKGTTRNKVCHKPQGNVSHHAIGLILGLSFGSGGNFYIPWEW